jgi:HNH endonuclease
MEVSIMQHILLSQNKVALVDDDDFARFSKHRWCYRADRNQGPGCAVRHVKVNGKDRLSYLHREVMDAPAGKEVIFLNHDRLDCRKENLKIVSKHEAKWYHQARRDSETGIKGVKYKSSARKWYASITRFGDFHHLGAFDTKEKALEAYRQAEELLAHQGQDRPDDETSEAATDLQRLINAKKGS